ncbi:MAG: hypothetical protein A4E23_01512 [Methanomethylovorans sp. PtaU1.Bin073]|nr:MAG: hypothetical protein A4E23_01512 [Methanomethylovorans sp. PtaU1.Bin073]
MPNGLPAEENGSLEELGPENGELPGTSKGDGPTEKAGVTLPD